MNKNQVKQTIRQTCLKHRRSLSSTEQQTLSLQICDHIKSLQLYQLSEFIAVYIAIQGEVDLSSLWNQSSTASKNFFFPAIQPDETLLFLPANRHTSFRKNRFGILEPDISTKEAIAPTQLEIIFMPLVAFDACGHRIGMGAGYYDRTLGHDKSACFIGIAYDFQKQPNFTPDPWDVPLDMVVTEKEIFRF